MSGAAALAICRGHLAIHFAGCVFVRVCFVCGAFSSAFAILHLAIVALHAFAVSDFMVAAFENEDRKRFTRRHPPPLLTEQDTYLLNRVFRI